MKLITEVIEEQIEYITEAKENGGKDYKIKGSGYTIFQRTLPLNFKNLEQRILQELSETRQLESGVDKILSEI